MVIRSLAATLMMPVCLAAAATNIEFISVDNSSILTGYNTSDIQITTTSDWTSSALLLELDSGSVYQNAYGGATPPNPAMFSIIPKLEFDTYVSVPGGNTVGAAGDVGGDSYEFSEAELDVSYFNTSNADVGTFPIGRITLSSNATGTWVVMAATADNVLFNMSGTIDQGDFTINPLGTFFAEPEFSVTTLQEGALGEKTRSGGQVTTIRKQTGKFFVTRPHLGITTIEPWYNITKRDFESKSIDLDASLPEPGSLLVSGLLATVFVVGRRS